MSRSVAFFSIIWLLALTSPTLGEEFHPSPYGLMGFPYSHKAEEPDALEQADRFMNLYLLTGARWDRRDFWWAVAEPEPDVWEWSYFDEAMRDFREADVNAVVILCYQAADMEHAPSTSEEIKRYGEYVFRIVDRYKDQIKHWEVWNEPNILPFWTPKPDTGNYVALLQEAYRRAKEADPDCVILGGATAGPDVRFLREMYAHGAKGYFDVLSYHTYGNDPDVAKLRRDANALREVMREQDDEKPLWITETGIYSGPGGVPEDVQAKRSIRMLIDFVSMGIERIFHLSLKDWTDDPALDPAHYRGLARYDGSPKPFFLSHRTLCDMLGELDYIGSPVFQPGITSHVFSNGHDRVMALWATQEETEVEVNLPLDSTAVTKVSMAGDREVLRSKNSHYHLTVTDEPLYLEGVGPLVEYAARIELRSEFPEAVPGSVVDIDVVLPESPEAARVLGVFHLYDHKSRALSPAYRPGQVITIPITLEVSDESDDDVRSLPIAVVMSNSTTGEFGVTATTQLNLHASIEVAQPFALRILPYRELARPAGTIALEITNHRREPESATLSVTAPGLFESSRVSTVELAASSATILDDAITVSSDSMDLPARFDISAAIDVGDDRAETSTEFRLMHAYRLEKLPQIDADLSEWFDLEPALPASLMTEVDFNESTSGGEADQSMRGWIGWTEDDLYFAFEVHDDVLHLPTDTTFWNYDTLQIAIDGLNDAAADETFDGNDFEIEVARMSDGSPGIFAGFYPEGRISDVVENDCELATGIDREAGVLRYELRIPAAVINPVELRENTVFGFNLIHNDNDRGGVVDREGWIELAPGIGYGKEPEHFWDVVLW